MDFTVAGIVAENDAKFGRAKFGQRLPANAARRAEMLVNAVFVPPDDGYGVKICFALANRFKQRDAFGAHRRRKAFVFNITAEIHFPCLCEQCRAHSKAGLRRVSVFLRVQRTANQFMRRLKTPPLGLFYHHTKNASKNQLLRRSFREKIAICIEQNHLFGGVIMETLRFGSRGAQVEYLQLALQRAGDRDLAVDGFF